MPPVLAESDEDRRRFAEAEIRRTHRLAARGHPRSRDERRRSIPSIRSPILALRELTVVAQAPTEIALPELTPHADVPLEPHGDYDAVSFTDLDLSGQVANNARLLDCALFRCRADGLQLRRARFVETLVADLQASHPRPDRVRLARLVGHAAAGSAPSRRRAQS